jgi:putative ATPase
MNSKIPLAERLRPTSLDTYMGQEQLVGENASLRKAIDSGFIPSLILWGPPGVGKTTLANIIANTLKRPFYTLSAINSGVKDIREIIEKVKNQGMFGGSNAILFIDEIHRFSKSQQDSLLGAVEKGVITLIGATTENPSFEVIPALLSRSQVYILEHFTKGNLDALIRKAVAEDVVLKEKNITIEETDALIGLSGGDARKLLNLLELTISSANQDKLVLNDELVKQLIKNKTILYDKSGEQHYDIISAFIKSIRGSDPNAALYWLARMIEGGEDAKFIARRLLILSSEDIGNANPTAIIMANNCFQAVNVIGWPESRIILSQCVTYLACSAKSNASYKAISLAQQKAREVGNLPIPLHLRNAPTKLMKELNYGKGYEYSHSQAGGFSKQEYMPEELSGTKFFEPGNNARENELRKNLQKAWGDKYGY